MRGLLFPHFRSNEETLLTLQFLGAPFQRQRLHRSGLILSFGGGRWAVLRRLLLPTAFC